MQLTKFTHACVRLDDDGRALVIDPGSFSEVDEALEGSAAVLITHEHADHIDTDRVRAALGRDPRLRLYAPASVAGDFADLGEQVATVAPGDRFEAAGFAVQAFGGLHALIHPAIPLVANLGYLVEGVYHPGDSFIVPTVEVRTLLLPTNAPWSKAGEVIDFAIAVRAPRVHQIHDSLVTGNYAALVEGLLERLAGPHGVAVQHLEPRQSVAL